MILRRLPVALLSATVLISLSVSVASAATQTTASPQTLYAAALKAGHAQRSVHWASRATSGGTVIAMVCDVARTSGIQRISYRDAVGSGTATVMILDGDAYLRGDAFTLTEFMGFKALAAAKYAGAWIEIPKANPHFAAVAAGVTLRSAIDQVEMVTPLRALPDTFVHRQKVLAIAGEAPGSTPAEVHLYARPSAPHLPVGAVSKTTGAATSIFFSRWNERVALSRPAHAVLITRTGL